ncbi:hypothetical protein N7532_008057 [Penicillium argentinense]|uniref:Glucose-methanol-choline oxidoreductase N-terminal domain-containing protein n=1 Tax=Penicillium argentinense TaxID=1131581 RepID=A0A9W9EWL8_9EURO|nr:uncharacterized protein N7532_008057 [Penicillium argentinense]KAJ5089373.1 hypothetical protein N7532_008057 [Penicillium argentinense]
MSMFLRPPHCEWLALQGDRATGVEVRGPNGEVAKTQAYKEVIVGSGVYESSKRVMLSGIGPENALAQFGMKAISSSLHVGQNLPDHPILPHVFRLKHGLGLGDHLLRAGPQKAGAVSAYNRSDLLDLVGYSRIDERLARIKEYVKAKQDNGGKDLFGPAGQPRRMFFDAFQWHNPVPQKEAGSLL